LRFFLYCIVKAKSKAGSVSQQMLKARRVFRGGNDQDFANTRQHQRRERVINHRLVVDRQQAFANPVGSGIQARPRSSSENNAFISRSSGAVTSQPSTPLPNTRLEAARPERHELPFYCA